MVVLTSGDRSNSDRIPVNLCKDVIAMEIGVRTIFLALLLPGAAAIATFVYVARRSPPQLESGEEVIPLLVVDGKSGFVCTGAGDGIGSSVQLFESLDGVRIAFSQWSFHKRQEKVDLEERLLNDSLKITDRCYQRSTDGGAKGERIAGVFRDSRDPAKCYAAVYWISADAAECIAGDSLDHVLSFEKLYAGWTGYADTESTR